MNNESIIYLLFVAQRDVFYSLKDHPDTMEAFQRTNDCEHALNAAIEGNQKLVDLYDDLDEAQMDFLNKTEYECYKQGFKAGFRLATEINTEKLTDVPPDDPE